MQINNLIIPAIVLIIIFYGFFKKQDIYTYFIDGAIDGLKIVYEIIPTIVAMIFAVNIFIGSGLLNDMFKGAYGDIASMLFLRPISGNASLAMLNKIYQLHGVDSFWGFLASVIQGSTDTTIYVLALYFSSIKVKKSRYALGVGLFADCCGFIAALVVAKIFF